MGDIINCYNSGNVVGIKSNVAGIVGQSPSNLHLKNCYNSGLISSEHKACGLGVLPKEFYATLNFDNCYNSGNVNTTYTSYSETYQGDYATGGIINLLNNYTTITNCHNTGKITRNDGLVDCGEIVGYGSLTGNSNDYLIRTDENNNNINAAANGATGKTQEEMDEIMSIQSFVNLMNDYVDEYNESSETVKLKKWKVVTDNGKERPAFIDE